MADCPWYGWLVICISVLALEAIYKKWISDDFMTSELFDSFLKIFSKFAEKFVSDVDGEKKCAYIVAAAALLSFLLLFGFSLKGAVGPQGDKDTVTAVLLFCAYLPYVLILATINDYYVSWVKKRRSN